MDWIMMMVMMTMMIMMIMRTMPMPMIMGLKRKVCNYSCTDFDLYTYMFINICMYLSVTLFLTLSCDLDLFPFPEVTEKPSWNDRSTIKVEKKTTKLALWQCSVCNSDNEQSSSSCDICGVLRVPAQNIGNGSAENGMSFYHVI